MTWFDGLLKRVDAQEQQPHVLRVGEARLLVTERGARVLACELPGVLENLFFHTEFSNEDKSAGFLTGGDRLWIAPEIAYFWPSLDDALSDPKRTAKTPTEIDPAEWHDMHPEDEDRVELACGMTLHDKRTDHSAQLIATREVMSQHSPLGGPGADALVGVSFVLANSVELQSSGDTGVCAGAWDILQVPPGGRLVCPVSEALSPSDIRSYYEPFGDRHVMVDEGCVRFWMDGRRRVKMGIRAEHTTGQMGYYRSLGDGRSSLIFRAFAPRPGEAYCDVPRDDTRNRALEQGEIAGPVLDGDCLQAYNDDGDAFGGGPEVTFGEMEYHDPCVVMGEGEPHRAGSCVTHVVAGPDEAVRAWGEAMLGVPLEG